MIATKEECLKLNVVLLIRIIKRSKTDGFPLKRFAKLSVIMSFVANQNGRKISNLSH